MSTFDPKTCTSLFHGTGELLNGPLRPGAYDAVFWTAESSAVAQTYIPTSGFKIFSGVSSYQMGKGVRPSKNDPFYSVAKIIGPAAKEIQWDVFGQANSWIQPKGYATYQDVANYLQKEFGYVNMDESGGCAFELLADRWNSDVQELEILPSNFKRMGSLIIIDGFSEMKFLDISTGDSDLNDLQYNKHKIFNQARDQGFDGVVIDDFCQTLLWGNVGHRSVGFFDHAISKLITKVIPASNFEWGPKSIDLQVLDSQEYLEFKKAQSIALASIKFINQFKQSKNNAPS